MSTRIFMKDLEKICDIVNGENIDYKTSFAEFVFDNIIETEEKPALEEIVNQWDLKECVERYVEADEELKSLYKAWDGEADIYETFFKALYVKQNQKFKEIRQGLIGMTEELKAMSGVGRVIVLTALCSKFCVI